MTGAIARTWRRFVGEEQGGGTIWALFWLVLSVGIGGLAVDVSNAQRAETIMQATADAIVHDAALELPDEQAAKNAALATAGAHMRAEDYGTVLVADELEVGVWDWENRSFGPAAPGEKPDAVRATLRLSRERGNPLATLLLKVTGFDAWEISASATAVLDWEKCYLDGLISASKVIMDSGNIYGDNFCVYGRQGVQLVNENDYTGTYNHAYAGYSSAVTHQCGFYLMGVKGAPPDCSMASNPGLARAKFISDKVYPERLYRMEDGTPKLDVNGEPVVTLGLQIQALAIQAKSANHLLEADWRGSGNQPNAGVTARLMTGGAFFLECAKDSGILELKGEDYKELLLVTNCLLELPGGSNTNPNIYDEVTFVSTSSAKFKTSGTWRDLVHNIVVRGGNVLGTDCLSNRGANFFTMTGVKFDGGVSHNGTQVNAGGSVGFDGDNNASSTAGSSISVHALGDIIMTSGSTYALCHRLGEFAEIIPYPVLVN